MMSYLGYTIEIGNTNKDILFAIKTKLNELGFGPLTPTIANYGLKTVEAVKSFQKSKGLIQDGRIGELTWEKLFSEVTDTNYRTSFTLRVRAVGIALTKKGIKELTGNNDGVEIEAILRKVGLNKGHPYCQAGIYDSFDIAAHELSVINPVPRTAGVLDCYNKANKAGFLVTEPELGDQFFMDFGGGKGHAGLIIKRLPNNKLHTIEFNTSEDPTIPSEDRDGGGVFERIRNMSSIKGYARYK